MNRSRHGLVFRGDWSFEMNRIPWMRDKAAYQVSAFDQPSGEVTIPTIEETTVIVPAEPEVNRRIPITSPLEPEAEVERIPVGPSVVPATESTQTIQPTQAIAPVPRAPARRMVQQVQAPSHSNPSHSNHGAECGFCSTPGVLLPHGVRVPHAPTSGGFLNLARFFPVPTRPTFAPGTAVPAPIQPVVRPATVPIQQAPVQQPPVQQQSRRQPRRVMPSGPDMTVLPPAPIRADTEAMPLGPMAIASPPRQMSPGGGSGRWVFVPRKDLTRAERRAQRAEQKAWR